MHSAAHAMLRMNEYPANESNPLRIYVTQFAVQTSENGTLASQTQHKFNFSCEHAFI